MSDFQKYKAKRISKNPEFWEGYEERYENFKIGESLKKAREEAGMTQENDSRKSPYCQEDMISLSSS